MVLLNLYTISFYWLLGTSSKGREAQPSAREIDADQHFPVRILWRSAKHNILQHGLEPLSESPWRIHQPPWHVRLPALDQAGLPQDVRPTFRRDTKLVTNFCQGWKHIDWNFVNRRRTSKWPTLNIVRLQVNSLCYLSEYSAWSIYLYTYIYSFYNYCNLQGFVCGLHSDSLYLTSYT